MRVVSLALALRRKFDRSQAAQAKSTYACLNSTNQDVPVILNVPPYLAVSVMSGRFAMGCRLSHKESTGAMCWQSTYHKKIRISATRASSALEFFECNANDIPYAPNESRKLQWAQCFATAHMNALDKAQCFLTRKRLHQRTKQGCLAREDDHRNTSWSSTQMPINARLRECKARLKAPAFVAQYMGQDRADARCFNN
jgi:hypothetical protein